MQAQQTRNTTQSINYTQSLAAVQTLLRAGLGSIAYLRDLLPEENFTNSHFTTTEDLNASSRSFQLESQESSQSRRSGNGFSTMTLMRGYTDEADRLLNYLEYGIFDALEKQYLRSFIFAVYLDPKDPNNIVEAYTYNFIYHTIPGTNTTVPVMSLGEDSKKASGGKKAQEDPVAKAIKSGKTPTLKEVKISVKTLIKTLITSSQSMDRLPRRRFATFKVFYTDNTPLDYEPPYFQAGDIEKDRFYFMTHNFDEVPEKISIGKVDTGHHAVNLTVTSVASFLPSESDIPSTTHGGQGGLTLTPLQETYKFKEQAELQLEDAEKRNLVWSGDLDVELTDADAEGDDDPDFVLQSDGSYAAKCSDFVPIGVRGQEGVINPVPEGVSLDEAEYRAVSETVPKNLQEMYGKAAGRGEGTTFEETQELVVTPKNKATFTLPPSSPIDQPMASQISDSIASRSTTRQPDLDTDMFERLSIRNESHDTEMLDLETQLPRGSEKATESIESFGAPRNDKLERTSSTAVQPAEDKGLDCDCDIDLEDECFLCEGGCQRWFHVWCMGYHSINDPRIPTKFVCFDCRAHGLVEWDYIELTVYPQILSKFKELTAFRRAIKTAEQIKAFTPAEFYKAYGCDTLSGADLLKRLAEDGEYSIDFILKETTTVNDAGFTTTEHTKSTKSKGRAKARPRRNMQKMRYVFNFSFQSKPEYMNYFKADDREMENKLLGIHDMLLHKTNAVDHETQTQEDTQPAAAATVNSGSKRAALSTINSDEARPAKKMKISVVSGVDLAN